MEARYYLDTQTAELLPITDEARQNRDALYEEHFDLEKPADLAIEDLLAQSETLYEWQKQQVLEADPVPICIC